MPVYSGVDSKKHTAAHRQAKKTEGRLMGMPSLGIGSGASRQSVAVGGLDAYCFSMGWSLEA